MQKLGGAEGGYRAHSFGLEDRRASINTSPAYGDTATLSTEQQAAIQHIWQSRDRVTLVRGAAGAGKTTMMQAAAAGIDVPVVVLAPSARASRGVLREEGFAAANTVARFLADEAMQQQAQGGVIWVDEAGLAGSRDMAKLFAVADRVDARIILQGDIKQHASVARGSPMQLLQEYAGLKPAELTDIKRQRGQYREAVANLERGDIATGFDQLDRLGWVYEVPEHERYQYLADTYLRTLDGGETALVVSPTHAEGNLITLQIRNGLKNAGKLARKDREFHTLSNLNWTRAQVEDAQRFGGEPGVMLDKFGAYREDMTSVAKGDLIRVTKGEKTKDGKHRVENGNVYEVAGFAADGGIKLTNGWALSPEFRHFTHGYVVTSHASQGRTVDRVIIGQSSDSFAASSREQFYVSASRGRKQALVFTDDMAALKQAVQRTEPRMSATDLLKKPKRRRVKERLKQAVKSVIDKTRDLLQPDHASKDRQYER